MIFSFQGSALERTFFEALTRFSGRLRASLPAWRQQSCFSRSQAPAWECYVLKALPSTYSRDAKWSAITQTRRHKEYPTWAGFIVTDA